MEDLPQNSPVISHTSSVPPARRRGPDRVRPVPVGVPTPLVAALDRRDPPMESDLSAAAITKEDWMLLQKFNKKLDDEVMEFCARCREKWFNMQLRQGICAGCRYREEKKKPEDPLFFSAENHLDFGDVPDFLPPLTQVEEQLIARVHVHVDVCLFRGQQYKYKGHVINFLRDVGKICNQLPLLPRDLDIIILRPANARNQPHVVRQFRRNFYVSQSKVRTWLQFLVQNHPGYRDVHINEANLQQLPEGENVIGQFPVQEIAPIDIQDEVDEEDQDQLEEPDVAGVPDFNSELAGIDQLRVQLAAQGQDRDHPEQPPLEVQPYLEMGDIRQTPLNEFNNTQALLSLAFPTLFPRGEAEFILSRLTKISYQDYVRHAMKWHDGRFASHPRFRFVAFNTIMRQQVNGKSTYFVHHTRQAPVTAEELRSAFENQTDESRRLLNSIMRFSDGVKGTRPFWNGKRHELEAHVYALKCPSLFMTFSPADLHWDSLARHMPRYEEWKTAPEAVRMRISRENLRDYPHIAAYHFHSRFKHFREIVVKSKFEVTDFWERKEWQSRGSPHSHGMYWTTSPLPLMETQAQRDEFARYWGYHVTAENPEPTRVMQQDEANILTTVHQGNQPPTLDILSRIVNRVQRHGCGPAYCLRRRKLPNGHLSDEPLCRFYYPRSHHAEASVTKDLNPKHWTFDGIRNDARLNGFNRTITLGWMANTDITPCTSAQAAINYIAKYCSKAETKSKSYSDLVREVLPSVSSRNPVSSLVSKLLNKLVAERDWSAQEICHILLDLPLQSGNRVVRKVDCRQFTGQNGTSIGPGNEVRETVAQYTKYLKRPLSLEALTYFQFLTTINWTSSNPENWTTYSVPRILNYFPRYKPDSDDDNFEDFCRIKLMLNHPHRQLRDLLSVGGPGGDIVCFSYREAYDACQNQHEGHDDDYYGQIPDTEDDDEFEPGGEEDEDELTEAEFLLARELPNRRLSVDQAQLLGNRDLDLLYDWLIHVGRYQWLVQQAREYWKKRRAEPAPMVEIRDVSCTAAARLNPEQKLIYDMFAGHYEAVLDGGTPEPLLVQVDGRGGTGKSHVINLLSARLDQLAVANGHLPVVVRSAPTGVAANNINGSTLHSLLRLPVSKAQELEPLVNSSLTNLQNKLRQFRYLILDEKSMIGLRQLAFVDQRLRQAFPQSAHQYFGGMNVLLLGDFFQLPPVAEKALYSNDDNARLRTAELAGRNAYRAFSKTVELKEVVRQQGEDQASFREALDGLRFNNPTAAHWELLSSRLQMHLTPEEIKTFDSALRIYPTNKQVEDYNTQHLEQLDSPCIQVLASHTGTGAKDVPSKDAGNLEVTLPLAVGARVMLTENLWTGAGLVNGSLGTVRDLAWEEGSDPRTVPPFVVLVQFDRYSGPPCFGEEENDMAGMEDIARLVPVFRSTRDFIKGSATCTRTQFPLTVAYAITVHKSQGATLDLAVMDISRSDFQPGLTYVAVSRVRSLQGIMFDCPFDLDSLRSNALATINAREEDRLRRVPQHVPLPVYP
jgi:ATP-dependent DNA helicase PIF1